MPHLFSLSLALLVVLVQGCATTTASKDATTEFEKEEERSAADYVAAGDREYMHGSRDAALVQYVLALDAGDRNASTFHKIGTLHRVNGDLDLAEESFRQAVARDPQSLDSRVALGLLHLERGNHALAETMLTSVLEADPTRLGAINALGILYDLQERHTEAQRRYLDALALDPRSARYTNNLGYSYYLEGRHEEAAAEFRKAIAFDESYERAWSNLALVHARRGELRQARSAFDQIVAEHRALNNLGYLNMLMGRERQAREDFRRSMHRAPSHYVIAQRNLASLDNREHERLSLDDANLAPAGEDRPRSIARSVRVRRVLDAIGRERAQKGELLRVSALGAGSVAAASGARAEHGRGRDLPSSGSQKSVRLTRATVRRLQRGLKRAGYDPGPIDGKLGSKSLSALRRYKRAEGMAVDARVTEELIARLESS